MISLCEYIHTESSCMLSGGLDLTDVRIFDRNWHYLILFYNIWEHLTILQYLFYQVNWLLLILDIIAQYETISGNIWQYLSILNNIRQYWTISINICLNLTIFNNITTYLASLSRLCCSETFWLFTDLVLRVVEELLLLKTIFLEQRRYSWLLLGRKLAATWWPLFPSLFSFFPIFLI